MVHNKNKYKHKNLEKSCSSILCLKACKLEQESLANANVKRATAVHVWRPQSKKSKLEEI